MSSEPELVRRCLAGDRLAATQLVQTFEQEVFGLCFRILRQRQDAEDTAQEVFGRVFQNLHRWDGIRPLRPWILRITVNRCRTNLTKRRRNPEPVEYLAQLPAMEEPTSDRELLGAIEMSLAEMRPDYREVFVLYHQLGKSYEEIAEVLQRPVGTVKTWLHRARGLLATALSNRGLILPVEPTATEQQT